MEIPPVGVWLLTAATAIDDEVDLEGLPAADQIDEWLYSTAYDLIDEAEPVSGLKLTIHADGTFTEEKTGLLNLPWYDREGVLDEAVTPFSGILKTEENLMYLHLEEPISWATPEDTIREVRVRYDDGDTIICDRIEIISNQLVRTMSVVTDELYLNKVLLIYQKT
ncbi:MAG: hypothetical protein KME42_05810 [Tildeniella nuda ZEHNDER 1965/U140]|jgi:hypothetical protein|nr:hypothetical protein [Tildeniella nuda ZEHNDER 1965/U140]